jgi:glycosyltransferase involved in cell wall biosynthesis
MKANKIKVVYVISIIDRAIAFELIEQYLNKEKFELDFVLLNEGDSFFEDYLKNKNYNVKRFRITSSKSSWIIAGIQLFFYLLKKHPRVVHCHFYEANIIGLTAAFLAGIKKRIYTRHFSSLHHKYFKKGVKIDKICNRLATSIISISRIVTKTLIELDGAPKEKIIYIPHGIQLNDYREISEARIEKLKLKYNIKDGVPVVGVISRFTEWKGVQYIIPAFQKFLVAQPDAILILLNAVGEYKDVLQQQLNQLPQTSYRIIPFERDIAAAYKLFSIFVHVPIEEDIEAFGLVYIESMAAGIPSIFTKSGVINNLADNKNFAEIVDFKDSDSIYKKLCLLTEDKKHYELISKNALKLSEDFDIHKMIKSLEELYVL